MVDRHRQLMKRENPFPLRRETCIKVIDSPRGLLVWGLHRGFQTGTQQLGFFQGEKKSGGHMCVYLFPQCTLPTPKKKKGIKKQL